MSEQAQREPRGRRRSPLGGVIGLAVGIGAVVLANETKLTIAKAILGGAFVKDQYRTVLMAGGYGLIALSLLLVLLASSTTTDLAALRTLQTLVGLLTIGVFVGCGLIYAGYKHAQQAASSASSPGLGLSSIPPTSSFTTTTDTTATDTTGTDTSGSSTGSLPQPTNCYVGAGECYLANCRLSGTGCSDIQGNPVTTISDGVTDHALGCTWRNEGQNAGHVVELYQCALPNTGSTPSASDAAVGRCGALFAGPDPQDVVSNIRTQNVGCDTARSVALASRQPGASFDARTTYTLHGFSCSGQFAAPPSGGKGSINYTCSNANASIRFIHQ